MGERGSGSGRAGRLTSIAGGSATLAHRLMVAGGLAAAVAAAGAHRAHMTTTSSLLIAGVGITTVALSFRMRRLADPRLALFYSGAVLVFGLTTAGQAYLGLGLPVPDRAGRAALWLVLAGGLAIASGASTLLLIDPRQRS